MMMAADWHVYQVLTKRPDIMAAYFREVLENPKRAINIGVQLRKFGKERSPAAIRAAMPLKHVHLGFSAEDQDHLDERWPAMRSMAAAGRSEEHTTEIQSLMRSSSAVTCLT